MSGFSNIEVIKVGLADGIKDQIRRNKVELGKPNTNREYWLNREISNAMTHMDGAAEGRLNFEMRYGAVLIAMRDEFGMDNNAIGRELRKVLAAKGGSNLKVRTPYDRYLQYVFRQACMWGASNPDLVVETSKVYRGNAGLRELYKLFIKLNDKAVEDYKDMTDKEIGYFIDGGGPYTVDSIKAAYERQAKRKAADKAKPKPAAKPLSNKPNVNDIIEVIKGLPKSDLDLLIQALINLRNGN